MWATANCAVPAIAVHFSGARCALVTSKFIRKNIEIINFRAAREIARRYRQSSFSRQRPRASKQRNDNRFPLWAAPDRNNGIAFMASNPMPQLQKRFGSRARVVTRPSSDVVGK
jgi:hypothetical protein